MKHFLSLLVVVLGIVGFHWFTHKDTHPDRASVPGMVDYLFRGQERFDLQPFRQTDGMDADWGGMIHDVLGEDAVSGERQMQEDWLRAMERRYRAQ
jgi:hypothetical protein